MLQELIKKYLCIRVENTWFLQILREQILPNVLMQITLLIFVFNIHAIHMLAIFFLFYTSCVVDNI